MSKADAIKTCKNLCLVGFYAKPIYNRGYQDWEVVILHDFTRLPIYEIERAFNLKFVDCLIPKIGNPDYPVFYRK